MYNVYLLSGILAIIGSGVTTTLVFVVRLASKWGSTEERIKHIVDDMGEMKETVEKLVWERGSHAVQGSGRR